MAISMSSLVDAPIDEVFAWFERPGAFTRLMPPWQPMRLSAESASLRDGRAAIRVPPGLTIHAQHRPDGYRPPRQFVDEIVTIGIRQFVRWRHTHQFAPIDESTTWITDRIDTTIPGVLLRTNVAYRHRQLADDLAAHARLAGHFREPMTVAITGSNGLIGTALSAFLTTGGHRVIRLVRRAPRRPDERHWQPERPAPDLLEGVDAVVHLAGAPIFGRFNESHRRAIADSRIRPTRLLAECAARDGGPQVFVSASAVGFYGPDRGDETLTEHSDPGEGFLADLVADWEAATQPAAVAGCRVVNVRTGIVQSPLGGVLRLLYPVFLAGAGGRIGHGQQWMPWIGLDDLGDIYLRALVDNDLSGPVNAVAPEPLRNAAYATTLASVLRRPALIPVPSAAPRLVLGAQGADEFAMASQRVTPATLTRAGHVFRYPDLDGALRHTLGRLP